MDLELTDRVFIVTGASAGIGRAAIELLAAEGAYVVGAARHPEGLDGARVTAVPVNLTSADGPEELVRATLDSHSRLDGLVNNVGGVTVRGGFLEVGDDAWRSTLELNLLTAVRTTRAALPALLDGGGGLVHVASEAAHLPDPPIVDYAAAKAALVSLSKALATEFGSSGVRSNVVSPGPTRTRLWDAPGGFADQLAEQFELEREAAIEHFVTEVRGPLGRKARKARGRRASDRIPPLPRQCPDHRLRVRRRRRRTSRDLEIDQRRRASGRIT